MKTNNLVHDASDASGSSRSSAWTKRFTGLTALVQPGLPLPKPNMARNSSLGVLFSKSFRGDLDYDTDAETFCEEEALDTLQRVRANVEGILKFLNDRVPQHILQELQTMEQRYQYTKVLKQAEEYTQVLLLQTPELVLSTDVLGLFTQAWTSLQEYSQDRQQQIQKAHSELQLNQWKEQVTRASDEKDQEGSFARHELRLRQRNTRDLLADLDNDPEELASLQQQLASAIRFKMECQKHVILAKEWVRCMKRQAKALVRPTSVEC